MSKRVKVIGLAAAAVVVVSVGLVLAVPRLVSTESTSIIDAATKTVPRVEVEKQLEAHFNTSVGQQPEAVSCAGDLAASKINDTVECDVTDTDGTTERIAVSVTDIDDNKISYDYVVLKD